MLGTELGKLTGHLVAMYAAFSSLKIPWDFHSFLMGFVSSSRTEGVKEEFTVTSLISLSLMVFFFSVFLEVVILDVWYLYAGKGL